MSTTDVIDAEFIAGSTSLGRLPPPILAEVAFAGRSNVGKSSLINSLVQRKKLVRTSSTPGCTRGINIFRIRLREGAEIDFVDLPGYGYARRSKSERKAWGPLIEGFLTDRAGLRAVVVIIDVRRGLEEEDRQLIEFLQHIGQHVVLVATKTDKIPANKRKPRLKEIQQGSGVRVFGYAAPSGDGREALMHTLMKAAHLVPV